MNLKYITFLLCSHSMMFDNVAAINSHNIFEVRVQTTPNQYQTATAGIPIGMIFSNPQNGTLSFVPFVQHQVTTQPQGTFNVTNMANRSIQQQPTSNANGSSLPPKSLAILQKLAVEKKARCNANGKNARPVNTTKNVQKITSATKNPSYNMNSITNHQRVNKELVQQTQQNKSQTSAKENMNQMRKDSK